jgi:vitamin B12 transporter
MKPTTTFMPWRWKSSAALSGILFFLSLRTAAQDTPLQLDPVTVTASLYPENVSKTGRNIVIIKGEMFAKLPIHSIDELLRFVPGIEVQQRGPMGSQADIVIRGATFQQVLVILDGSRINDPNTGHFTGYIPIAPGEIDRIEILKGASSALYGSDAVGGVIHIITKTFAATSARFDNQAAGSLTVGEYALVNSNASFYYRKGKTAVAGGLLSNNTNGQPQRGTRGYFNNGTYSASLSHYFNTHWRLSVRTAYDQRKFSAQNFYTSFTSDTANEKVKSLWGQYQLVYEKDNNTLVFDGGYKWTQDHYSFNSAVAANNNKAGLLQQLTSFTHRFDEKTSLTSGLQFLNNTIRSNDRGDHHLKQAAAFMVLNQGLGSEVFISPALRLDWDERAGMQLIPQLNLSWKKGIIQYRASAGKTIRQADFTERFNNYNKALVTSGSIGNPELEPERSVSFEAGADIFAARQFRISATAFRRNQNNVIDYVNTPYSQMPRKTNLVPTGTYALATNIADVKTSGAEVDLQYLYVGQRQTQLSANLGLVLLHTSTSGAVQSFYISSHARFLANLDLVYTNKYFGVSVTGIYKNRKPQAASAIHATLNSDFFAMNSRIDVYFLKHHASLFAEVDNLFDDAVQDLLGSVLPGRWLMAGINVRF